MLLRGGSFVSVYKRKLSFSGKEGELFVEEAKKGYVAITDFKMKKMDEAKEKKPSGKIVPGDIVEFSMNGTLDTDDRIVMAVAAPLLIEHGVVSGGYTIAPGTKGTCLKLNFICTKPFNLKDLPYYLELYVSE